MSGPAPAAASVAQGFPLIWAEFLLVVDAVLAFFAGDRWLEHRAKQDRAERAAHDREERAREGRRDADPADLAVGEDAPR